MTTIKIKTRTVGQHFATVGLALDSQGGQLYQSDDKPYGDIAAAIADVEAWARAHGHNVADSPVVATASHVETIVAQRLDERAREMIARGVSLSYEQADEIGDIGMGWLRNRLGLVRTRSATGVVLRPES